MTRGAVIDTEALWRVGEGRLAGAGLDVTEPEPLPAGHPLWKNPNVLITPHTSGHSPHSGPRMFALFKENMRRFAAGEPLLNVSVIKRLNTDVPGRNALAPGPSPKSCEGMTVGEPCAS